MIDFHTHHSSPAASWHLRNADRWQQVENADAQEAFSLGLHPWRAHEYALDGDFWAALERLVALPQVWAVGECGLDKYYEPLTSGAAQQAILRQHFAIAERQQKPLILHTVGRYNETLHALRQWQKQAKNAPAVALHGFQANAQVARPFWQMGAYTSFGAAIFHHKGAQEALQACPDELFFLETDAENTYNLRKIYEKAATLRAVTVEQLQMQISANWSRFFSCFVL